MSEHDRDPWYDQADYYEESGLNAEFRAAHALGVCPECHFSWGLHDEGRCSHWRPAEMEADES